MAVPWAGMVSSRVMGSGAGSATGEVPPGEEPPSPRLPPHDTPSNTNHNNSAALKGTHRQDGRKHSTETGRRRNKILASPGIWVEYLPEVYRIQRRTHFSRRSHSSSRHDRTKTCDFTADVKTQSCHGVPRCHRSAAGQSVPLLVNSPALPASVLASCAPLACTPLRFVDAVSEYRSRRINRVVFPVTGGDFPELSRVLTERTERPVSADYLVPEYADPTYPRRRLEVYRLVGHDRHAWHAGQCHWRGDTPLTAVPHAHGLVDPDAGVRYRPRLTRPGGCPDAPALRRVGPSGGKRRREGSPAMTGTAAAVRRGSGARRRSLPQAR